MSSLETKGSTGTNGDKLNTRLDELGEEINRAYAQPAGVEK